MTHLADQLNENTLHTLAGGTIYARGLDYFQGGVVTDLRLINKKLRAVVSGSDDYDVKLWADTRGLDYDCSCPMGEEGECCKHVVAAGLAWLAQHGGKNTTAGAEMRDDTDHLRGYLLAQSKDTLADWLLQQCEEDAALHDQLKLRAARGKQTLDIKQLKEAVRGALAVSGFVDWRRMRDVARRAQSVIYLIEELLRDGHATAAAALADYALERGIAAYGNMDDSSGAFGDVLRQLAGLHLQACRRAGADYALTGKHLFKLMRVDDWGFFRLQDYAPLLNPKELAHYRKLAEKEWTKVPAVTPADGRKQSLASYEHYGITAIMEELARYENNLDELVQIKRRDLGTPYRFLEIAKLLKQAGCADEALVWAERGLESFPDAYDLRLIEFLAGEYQRRKRHGDAVDVVWNGFRRHPRLEAYKLLHATAKKAGGWPAQRKRALAHVRGMIDGKERRDTASRIGQSLLVDIHLWEKDVAAALRQARAGGATQEQWFQLARACEKDRPADAAGIYRDRLDDIVNRKNNGAYDHGAEIVKTVRTLMQRAKQNHEFNAWLEKIRVEHKAKRNFMQRLDAAVPAARKER